MPEYVPVALSKRAGEDARRELMRFLETGVHGGVFPGAVASVGQLNGVKAEHVVACAGLLEPGGAPVELSTPYDLASLTKPVVATLALRLKQSCVIDFARPVQHWLPELSGSAAGAESLEQLLSHRAGLSPWGGLFRDVPQGLDADARRAHMLRDAASRVADEPRASGSVYSDLGYLVAGAALSRAGGAALDELVRREVTEPLGISDQLFYAASLSDSERDALILRVAPTEQCSDRGRVVRGEVHDENCFAYGGIAGHAGLFGTAQAVLCLGLEMLRVLAGRSAFLERDLLAWALAQRPGGGYVVGWDTKSREGSSAGARFSARSFGHLGFTGTSLWCDPERERCAVLLSNRVHPTRDNIAIRELRPRFHDLAADLVLHARE
jgi:CubicO group peptidase (beta-lactamase class C family)